MPYKSPTLTEIFVDCAVAEGVWTYDDIVFSPMREAFKSLGFVQFELGNVAQSTIEIQQPPTNQRIQTEKYFGRLRCWNSERTLLVQLSSNQIAINQIGTYIGWPAFMQIAMGVFERVFQYFPQFAVRSIALNALDRFTVEKSHYRFGRYVNCDGEYVPKCLDSAINPLGLHIIRGESIGKQLHITVQAPTPEQVMIHFHTISADTNNLTNTVPEIKDALEIQHANLHELFESIITDTMRTDVLGGTI